MVRPRSAYIAFEAFPRPKGASTHMASMIRALGRKHGPVLLICLGFGDMPAYQEEPGVIIIRCKAYHPNMLRRAELFGESVAQTLSDWRESLELCVFRDPWGGLPALFGGFDFKLKQKTLFEVNALPSWELGYTYPMFRTAFALQHKIMDMEQACLDHCDRILTVSHVTAQALTEKGVPPDKITTLPNAASPVFFDSAQPINIEGMATGRWIGYMGSLHPWQGVENAVHAFSMIAAGHRDVNMVIVTGGKKENKKSLRKLIRKKGLEDRVLIKHPLPHEMLAPVVKRCDFTLSPLLDTFRNTKQGCCPLKIIESMAARVPVIASDLSVTRALVNHEKDGLLVPPGQIRPLALSMDRLLKDSSLLKALSEGAAQAALKHFHPEIIHAGLADCFDQTLKTNNSQVI